MRITSRAALLICLLALPSLSACGSGDTEADLDPIPSSAEESVDSDAAAEPEGDSSSSDEQDESSTQGEEDTDVAAEPAGDEQDSTASEDDAGEVQLDLVAAVNGVGLPLGEYQRQAFDTQRYFVERGLDPNSEEGQAELLALRRGVLLDMIHQALIEQAADDMGIAASDEEVAASLAEFEDELAKSMNDNEITAEEVAEMERNAIVGRKFVDRIAEDVPTEAPYYHARHVLCEERGPCEAALTRLGAGEDFSTVAADVSVDETSADRGGDLDWIPRLEGINVLPSTELEAALFALQPGERSAVIESDFGYHVVELIEIDEARPIDEEQSFQLRQRRVEAWLADEVRRADIVVYPEDLQDIIAVR